MPIRRYRHRLIVSLLAIFGAVPGGAAAASLRQNPKQAPGNRHSTSGHPTRAACRRIRFFSPNSFWNTPLPADARLDRSSHGIVSELTALVNSERARRTALGSTPARTVRRSSPSGAISPRSRLSSTTIPTRLSARRGARYRCRRQRTCPPETTISPCGSRAPTGCGSSSR